MTLTGGCQCGAVRYEVSAEPLEVYVCHCRECRRQSASAFGISVIVPAEAFVLRQGNLRIAEPADRQRQVLECMFWSIAARASATPVPATRRSASRAAPGQPPGPDRGLPIWTSRKLRGVVIPEGAWCFAEEPP